MSRTLFLGQKSRNNYMADEESSLENYVNDYKYNQLTEDEFRAIVRDFGSNPQNAVVQMRLNVEQLFV